MRVCSLLSLLSAVDSIDHQHSPDHWKPKTKTKNLKQKSKGGIEAGLGATVWLPLPMEQRLSGDRTMDDVPEHVRPDATVDNVLKLPALLPPSTSFRARGNGAAAAAVGVATMDERMRQQKTTRNRAAQYNRILPEIPDLYSSYSSSSNDCSQHSIASSSSSNGDNSTSS
uniref:Putative secreted peptide n=1 Tax=Anopheles braziliensis TaxID=58242 RepID=A0A2M3ZEC3_9DIPT